METFYQQLINLFIVPPGNLIYHIVLVFAVTAALQGVLISRRAGQGEYLGRALLGLGMVLAGQVALFVVSGLAWQGLANPHVVPASARPRGDPIQHFLDRSGCGRFPRPTGWPIVWWG